jgi:hypothetical protein
VLTSRNPSQTIGRFKAWAPNAKKLAPVRGAPVAVGSYLKKATQQASYKVVSEASYVYKHSGPEQWGGVSARVLHTYLGTLYAYRGCSLTEALLSD